MNSTCRIALACVLSIAGLSACGKKPGAPFVAPSVPLPGQIDLSIRRHPFDTNGVLRPYEAGVLVIAGPGIQDHPEDEWIWIDADSRMDGQPIPEPMIRGLSHGGAKAAGAASRCLTLGPAFPPWSLLPRRPGSTTLDLVLHTGREKWVCPPLVVEIACSEDEARMLAEFEASGASRFLDHKIGARRASEPDAPAPPYGALGDFARRHPDSYLAAVVRQRIRRLHQEDIGSYSSCSEGPLLPEDRQALAAILGRIDPRFADLAAEIRNALARSLAASENPEPMQRLIEVNEEWLRLATAARAESGTPE